MRFKTVAAHRYIEWSPAPRDVNFFIFQFFFDMGSHQDSSNPRWFGTVTPVLSTLLFQLSSALLGRGNLLRHSLNTFFFIFFGWLNHQMKSPTLCKAEGTVSLTG